MLERFGLAAKHRLGQNFLVDNHVVERILDLSEVGAANRVVEIGPGIGTLTLALLSRAGAVVSIEADAELEQVLGCHAAEHGNFAFIMGDALKVPASEVDRAFVHLGAEPASPDMLVANLPYNVAATVILKYLADMPSVSRCTVMVQKEVADRICATPGTKAYGAYTAKLGLYGGVTGRFEVPPRCFMPAPHVDSAVVRIDRGCPSEKDVDALVGSLADALACSKGEARAFSARVIDAAFAQRRKTIRNSMSASGFEKAALDAAFERAEIAPTCRAETLSTSEFLRLATALAETGESR